LLPLNTASFAQEARRIRDCEAAAAPDIKRRVRLACGAQPMIRNYAGMLSNAAPMSVVHASDPKNRPYTRILLECGEWHEGCKASSRKRLVFDAYSD